MIQYYYTKKEWGVVMEKEELKILEELRRILNSKRGTWNIETKMHGRIKI
jgi:hypothetical protein